MKLACACVSLSPPPTFYDLLFRTSLDDVDVPDLSTLARFSFKHRQFLKLIHLTCHSLKETQHPLYRRLEAFMDRTILPLLPLLPFLDSLHPTASFTTTHNSVECTKMALKIVLSVGRVQFQHRSDIIQLVNLFSTHDTDLLHLLNMLEPSVLLLVVVVMEAGCDGEGWLGFLLDDAEWVELTLTWFKVIPTLPTHAPFLDEVTHEDVCVLLDTLGRLNDLVAAAVSTRTFPYHASPLLKQLSKCCRYLERLSGLVPM